jgi:hypothetical protein
MIFKALLKNQKALENTSLWKPVEVVIFGVAKH